MKLVFAFFTMALVACSSDSNSTDGGTDAPTDTKTATACSGDFDCPSAGDHCYFAIDGGCTIQGLSGVCMNYSQPASCTPNVACGCDGTTISICAPAGYVDRSSRNAGACPPGDSGVDASDADLGDSASDAATDADATGE